ncbi:MAG: hypothetical protein IBX70_01730 [Clostridia bacterium]|nr:hypothetical protein [Clostridia bacterium]
MHDIIEKLKKWIILSLSDIQKIRSSIELQYSNYSSQERAKHFAAAVHKLLDQHLDGISIDQRESLKKEIINSTLLKNIDSITKFDVFTSIFELDLDNDTQVMLAKNWLKESEKIVVKEEEIKSFLNFYDQVPSTIITKKRIAFKAKWSILSLLSLLIIVIASIITFAPEEKKPVAIARPFEIVGRNYAESFPAFGLINTFHIISEINYTDNEDYVGFILHYQVYHPFFKQHEFPYPYRLIDYFSLVDYIKTIRNGAMAESGYFNMVMSLARINDIDPLLLFAIIGHEQAFVPKDHAYAFMMINNPYNVYNSWWDYNTTLSDSTTIAINTIKNRMLSLPLGTDPLVWLNGIYAEDPYWHIGVGLIYGQLDKIASVKRIL